MQLESATEYIGHSLNLAIQVGIPCTYPSCLSVFSKFYSFKRHMLNHRFHQDTNNVVENAISENRIASLSCMSAPPKIHHANEIDSKKQRLEHSLADIKSAAVNFTLKLHQKNNLTRADVRSILKYFQYVCSIVAEKIEQIPLQTDAESQINFETYVDTLKTTFDFINTDYKLLKYLTEQNLYKLLNVITIKNNRNTTFVHRLFFNRCTEKLRCINGYSISVEIFFREFKCF